MIRSLIPRRNRCEISNFHPENVFGELNRQMNYLFNDFTHDIKSSNALSFINNKTFDPSFDITETEKGVNVKAELSGMEQKDIDVTIADNTITIKGKKKKEKEEDGKKYHVVERQFGSFERSFSLSEKYDVENVTASFKKGVLDIKIPKLKKEETKKTKIEIKQ